MKEAIGTTTVFSLIMVFTGVLILLFVGAISYSKTYKIRNRIIDIVEKHYGYNDDARLEIEEDLASIGYRISNQECPQQPRGNVENALLIGPQSDYRFCIYQYQANRGNYYGVLVFLHFDVPLLRNGVNVPVYGETKTLFDASIQG